MSLCTASRKVSFQDDRATDFKKQLSETPNSLLFVAHDDKLGFSERLHR